MAETLTLGDFKDMTLPAISAAGGLVAGKVAPSLLGFTPGWKRTGLQAALGLGAIYAGSKAKSDATADAMTYLGIGVLGLAFVELVGRFFPAVALSGIAEDFYETEAPIETSAYPEEQAALSDSFPTYGDETMSAYPDESSSLSDSFAAYRY